MKYFILICFCFLMVGCDPPITSGEVRNKSFTPAHTVEELVWQGMDGEGYPVYGWEDVDYPDRWDIVIENENKSGEVVQRGIRVSHSIYDELNIGDWYKMNKN